MLSIAGGENVDVSFFFFFFFCAQVLLINSRQTTPVTCATSSRPYLSAMPLSRTFQLTWLRRQTATSLLRRRQYGPTTRLLTLRRASRTLCSRQPVERLRVPLLKRKFRLKGQWRRTKASRPRRADTTALHRPAPSNRRMKPVRHQTSYSSRMKF